MLVPFRVVFLLLCSAPALWANRIWHMRPRFRQIFHASATCVHAFAKSSTHMPHASTLSPNLQRIRHMRPHLRQIFHSLLTCLHTLAKSPTHSRQPYSHSSYP